MKKKILSLCMVAALAATAVVGGTLAYFTDTATKTNTFTVGNVDIAIEEKGLDKDGKEVDWDKADHELMPGSSTVNNIKKEVKVKNESDLDTEAYMWIEVWVPSALDDGDDHSPAAPGLGNSLHFNYGKDVTETKATFLGSKTIGEGADAVSYNGYVHYVKDDTAKGKDESTVALLDQVYMDKDVTQCTEHENCLILIDDTDTEQDGKQGTHYTGSWELIINAVGFQAEGFTIHSAIEEYYGKDLDAHLW